MRPSFLYGNPPSMETTHPLKVWRTDRDLKQKAAADLLGVSKPTISRLEKGRRSPSLKLAAQLSERTGIPINEFVRPVEAAE